MALIMLLQGKDPDVVEYAPPEAIDSITIIPQPPSPAHAGVVGKNMSFFDLMTKCGISPQEINEITRTARSVYDFRRIYPGQSYELYADSIGRLETFKFSISGESYIEVKRGENDLTAERKTYPFEVTNKTASGLITHSLFTSIQEQSLPQELGIKLSDIFAWDIDFFTDIHKNDYFRIVYEEKLIFDEFEKVEKKKIGKILAAEFNTRGGSHYAFLFENGDGFPGYFDDRGKSLRKQLLKAPLSYTRISSRYSRRRFHPVLHHYAPHYGIDYVAPGGTPVMSTGDGTVIKTSRTRANGNYVKIRHNNNYITYYLHLSRFAKGIKQGVKVKQGQVIGYVGATGYATAPHLDYRVKKTGRFVNPRAIKLPPAKPVSDANMASFTELRDSLLCWLQEIPIEDSRTTRYARTEPSKVDEKGAGNVDGETESHHSTTR